MFVKSTGHLQQSLFGVDTQLSQDKRDKLYKSKEFLFFTSIFSSINEEDFAPLFSSAGSRPNASIRALVSSSLLLSNNGWTIEELFNRIDFDLLTRYALGLTNLDDTPFCQSTYFNFQNRLAAYFGKTGENLLEKVFDHLTEKQIKELKIKSDIQRTDSFQALSNIRSYSRIQLLIEVLIRLHRILSQEDQLRCKELFSTYCDQTSSKFVYQLKRIEMPHELEKLGKVYHELYLLLQKDYCASDVFAVFERVYKEHFTIANEAITINTLHSNCLQSPDDLDATFRLKNGTGFRGEVVSVVETANPDNEINLITDVAIYPNNTDDSVILNERLPTIIEKTPDLVELHTDGGYGSSANDIIMEQESIIHVQTAIRGREAAVEMVIDKSDDGTFVVSCPIQTVTATDTQKRLKAVFSIDKCNGCLDADKCPTKIQQSGRVYYFDEEQARLSKRARNLEGLPRERQHLRPNVEATMKEFTIPFNHKGKLRIRGLFKTMLYAFTRAIAINFGRIYRLAMKRAGKKDPLASLHCLWSCVVEMAWLIVPDCYTEMSDCIRGTRENTVDSRNCQVF